MASTENVYYATIEFGKTEDGVKRVDFKGEYPSLPYGGMVGVQNLMVEVVLPALQAMGIQIAHSIGQDVPGVDDPPADSRVPPGQAKK